MVDKLTILIPCYNEWKYISKALDYHICNKDSYLLNMTELIIWDDWSTDNSVWVINEYIENYPFIRLVKNMKNMWRWSIIKSAINSSKTKYLLYIDSDLQISVEKINEMCGLLLSWSDIVITSKYKHSDIVLGLRNICWRSYSFLVRHLFWINIYDFQAGCKWFNSQKISKTLAETSNRRWFFDTELIVRGVKNWLIFFETPLNVNLLYKRKSSVSLFIDWTQMLLNLIKLWWSIWNLRKK